MFEFMYLMNFEKMIIKLPKNVATGKKILSYNIHIHQVFWLQNVWVSIQLLCNSIKTYSIDGKVYFMYEAKFKQKILWNLFFLHLKKIKNNLRSIGNS